MGLLFRTTEMRVLQMLTLQLLMEIPFIFRKDQLPPPSTIDKRLCIFGAGHYADSSKATLVTNITSGFLIGEHADSLHIEGLYINGGGTFSNNTSANNVVITRNYINGVVHFDGDRVTKPNYHSTISENVITGNIYCYNAIQATVANNIVLGILHTAENCYFSNNLFFGCPIWVGLIIPTQLCSRIKDCVWRQRIYLWWSVFRNREQCVHQKHIHLHAGLWFKH